MTKKMYLEGKVSRGTEFEVLTDDCSISITSFEGQGAAGVIERGQRHKLKKGDIIQWDHQAYLGSDPGPGFPWFTVPGIGRGSFYPSNWGGIDPKHLSPVVKKYQFDVEKFKVSLNASGIKISDVEVNKDNGCIYIHFKDSKLRYLRIPIEYEGANNCINIYHSESTKNGFWWNHEIKYNDLVKELLQYH